MTEPTIHGFCDEKFLPVIEAFTKNFRLDLELGAAFALAVECFDEELLALIRKKQSHGLTVNART